MARPNLAVRSFLALTFKEASPSTKPPKKSFDSVVDALGFLSLKNSYKSRIYFGKSFDFE
jgi:hypothetical protein